MVGSRHNPKFKRVILFDRFHRHHKLKAAAGLQNILDDHKVKKLVY